MRKKLTAVEFRVNGERIETVEHVQPPRKGEEIEVGAKFEDGKRLDSGITEARDWYDADYEVVLRGIVKEVKWHYHTALNRSERTAYVHLEPDTVELPMGDYEIK